MNATVQAILMFAGILFSNLITAWTGTAADGSAITQFSDVSPVQYGIAFGSAVVAFITQFKTAKSDKAK